VSPCPAHRRACGSLVSGYNMIHVAEFGLDGGGGGGVETNVRIRD
jgi:hypothetical protein